MPPPAEATSAAAGLYVHVPWCRRRCPYCDFYFEIGAADARFSETIRAEIEARAPGQPGPRRSVYFGGGTPSLLPASDVWSVLSAVDATWGRTPDAEVTLEANPEDFDAERFEAYLAAGVNRFSLGVQSFEPSVIKWLGRLHTAEQAHQAAAWLAARAAVSIDIIIGVPGDKPARAERDLDAALATGAQHVSAYLLTVEADTPLDKRIGRGLALAPDEDTQVDAYEAFAAAAARAGLVHYEVSSYARAGHEAKHNRGYWAGVPYVGVGPGAHSFYVDGRGRSVRGHNAPDWGGYAAAPGAAHAVETLAPDAAFLEGVAFGLRDLVRGVDLSGGAARHQQSAAAVQAVEATLLLQHEAGHAVNEGTRWRLSASGALFADAVARAVLDTSLPPPVDVVAPAGDADLVAACALSLDVDPALLPFVPVLFYDLDAIGIRPAAVVAALDAAGLAPEGRWLDLGAGKGAAAGLLAERFASLHVTGVDGLPGFVDAARVDAAARGVSAQCDFVCTDFTDPAHRGTGYDGVSMLACGEALGDLGETLDALAACVRPGGLIAFDDAYLSPAAVAADPSLVDPAYEPLALTRDAMLAHFAARGLVVRDERLIEDDAYRAYVEDAAEKIAARAFGLAASHPEAAEELIAFATRQQMETAALAEPVVIGVQWLLQRSASARC